MPYTTTITATLVPDITYKISCADPVRVFYMGQQVYGTGYSGIFIASTSVHLVIESDTTFAGTLLVTEIMTNFYDQYDGTGGVYCFQNAVNRWVTKYGFRPEWMSHVSNRLVTFKDGFPYVHNGPINTFYGQVQPSAIAGAHSEEGNTVKVYNSVGVEGDTPERFHLRTEVPYVQSTDLESSEFTVKEGVKYAGFLRDRRTPGIAGGYNVTMWKGDRMRGEIGKFIVYYLSSAAKRALKFVNINFEGSTGQTV
jgi:hypothetical protein